MGIIFFIVFFSVSFFFIEYQYKLYLVWMFGALITAVSFFDDRISLSPKIRLFIQILIGATIGISSIKIGYVSNIFGGIIDLETLSFSLFQTEVYIVPLIFTIIWYVFVFNALNWSDGIPGNTTGLSLICFIVLFLLGLKLYLTDTYAGGQINAIFIMQMSLILIGALIPFFYFDLKEKILMGDSGTMFLAFMLATLAIISGGKVATVLAVFGIYAVDAMYVIIRRLWNGKNPLTGDFTHLHHRLLDVGLGGTQILVLIFSLSFLFGITSLFLDKSGKIIVFGVITLFVLFLSSVLDRIKKIKFKK
ncbi:undecaprenyl/decaprenyl-phosphate alpha-N-acetylglucosaminyl 1-phosphate transferase [Candidatus Gracilibacteria bacterium]|nr:undecaprenyl/decaprenyl-phosphate alpha-N-acetylglucosaminyl 1-phosphate transferase [Candidatus Gracilibacteria bacterium]